MPGLLSDVKSIRSDVLLVDDGHFAAAVQKLNTAARDNVWLSESIPSDRGVILTNLYGARNSLQCTVPFATVETGEVSVIARINTVLADLDPAGAAAPRAASCTHWSPVSDFYSLLAAYRSILRGESLKYLVEEARDVLAASDDPHFLAAADRLTTALAPVHWKNKNQPAKNDTTVRQALTDVRYLLHIDVVGVSEEATASEAGRYIDTAVWVAIIRLLWR